MTDNVVMIKLPGPRERTPEVRASLRAATVKDVRDRLVQQSRISAKTWVHIGKCVCDVRDDLADDPGAFAALFAVTPKERKDERRFPFSYSTARQLISIAESDVTRVTSDHLPVGWRTLYHLSRLPAAKLKAYITSGAIHPMMTVVEASKLAGTKPRKKKKPPTERTYDKTYEQHLEWLKRFDAKKRLAELLNLLHDCGVTIDQLREIES